jgi:hypothetical protein
MSIVIPLRVALFGAAMETSICKGKLQRKRNLQRGAKKIPQRGTWCSVAGLGDGADGHQDVVRNLIQQVFCFFRVGRQP